MKEDELKRGIIIIGASKELGFHKEVIKKLNDSHITPALLKPYMQLGSDKLLQNIEKSVEERRLIEKFNFTPPITRAERRKLKRKNK